MEEKLIEEAYIAGYEQFRREECGGGMHEDALSDEAREYAHRLALSQPSQQSGGVDVDRLAVAMYLWKVPSKPWHQLDKIDRTFWRGAAHAILEFCKSNSDAFHHLAAKDREIALLKTRLDDTTGWVEAFKCQCAPEVGERCARCVISEENRAALSPASGAGSEGV